MKFPVYNQEGKKTGEMDLPDYLFNTKFNSDLVNQVVNIIRANQRIVRAHTKDRSEVRGGGKKPWRQKGTGRARHGSMRSPIWIGGGVTFGPRKEKSYKKVLPEKMRKKAFVCVLSQKAREHEIIVLDGFKIDEPKTKKANSIFMNLFKSLKLGRSKSLVALPKNDEIAVRAIKNLEKISVSEARNLNILDLLGNKYLILPKEAMEVLEKQYK